MKLSNFAMARRIVDERIRIATKIETARIGVTIDGTYQDDAMVELVRPLVLGELRAQVRRLDADLAALGITVD
ncbi:MAG: hypothetical protein P4L68_08160 [Methylovirgula sp.]|nr:hypothetical protein [Methylovirgula sp.]